MTRRLHIVLAAITMALCPAAMADEADLDALLDGVEAIASPGTPGPLLVFGPRVFPVVQGGLDGSSGVVVAAGRVGRGRFVAFGHTGFLGATEHDTAQLLLNSVQWASDAIAPTVFAPASLAAQMRDQGLDARDLPRDWQDHLHEVDVVCVGHDANTEARQAALESHMRKGGGVVMGGLGWGWLQVSGGKPLIEHPGNRLFAEHGLMWADGYMKDTAENGFQASNELTPELQAQIALDTIQSDEAAEGSNRQASSTLMLAARTLPTNDRLLRPKIRRLMSSQSDTIIPSKQSPLRQGTHDLERFLLTYAIAESRHSSAERVRAHPAAASFPGLPDTPVPRVTSTITIDPAKHGWKSTGLYAEPGRVIRVTVPDELAGERLAVRIGCHKDKLYHKDQWHRAPEITVTTPIQSRTTTIASAFGGPVFVELPKGAAAEPFEITVRGAIEAPMFVSGQTDLAEWRDSIRHRPAPWAELVTDKVIVSVPSKHVRELDDPDALMDFWDSVLDAAADLAARPRERDRPERYVADVQISAGYMHSGYPIMTHLDAASTMTSRDKLERGAWGLYHELGHNHQNGDWTFAGTGEVTCNLFSLYIIDSLCSPPQGERGHGGATNDVGLASYIADGAPYDRWKSKPFLALRMYIQMEEAFGWEPFKQVFADYRTLARADRPKNDEEKRDQWMVRFSREVGRNLGPFFETWGVPTSQAARDSINDLPVWMPDGFPPEE